MSSKVKIVFTDLDGTLLGGNGRVSSVNINCLKKLGSDIITRVIATGRSCHSFKRVISSCFPADFLIFSSGAGILNLHTEEVLYSKTLFENQITEIANILQDNQLDFMVHHSIPQNHKFVYMQNSPFNSDFDFRIQLYRNYAEPYNERCYFPTKSAQVIAILQGDALGCFKRVERELEEYQVTRTTSPLDGKSIWMEIYPNKVSKGSAAAWLCNRLNINRNKTLGIGNDYNDISLLDFTRFSFVVANAPTELREKYRITHSNNQNGFFHAIAEVINGF